MERKKKPNEMPVPIDRIKLVTAISQVYLCVAKKLFRSALCNILFDVKHNCLTLIAMDGFRAAVSRLPAELPNGQWLMLKKDALVMERTLEKSKEATAVVKDKLLVFLTKTDDAEQETIIPILSKISDFSEWRETFNRYKLSKYNTSAVFDTKDLEKALRAVKFDRLCTVKLYIEKKSIKLSAMPTDSCLKEEKESVIEAQITGDTAKQAFRWGYLMDVAKTFSGEIELSTNGASEVALFKQGDTEWLVMPMYVSSW